MFPVLQDFWCVKQVCNELWRKLAAKGQSEQKSESLPWVEINFLQVLVCSRAKDKADNMQINRHHRP